MTREAARPWQSHEYSATRTYTETLEEEVKALRARCKTLEKMLKVKLGLAA